MDEDNRAREAAQDENELLEIVDAAGCVVGLAPRRQCHGDPSLVHRAVHVLVRNSAGKIFLQKRARWRRVQPGKWDSSVGGHPRPGESYEEAAMRELAEELGVMGAKPVHLHDYLWRSDIETELVRTFAVGAEGPFLINPAELEQGRFWGEGELRVAAGTGIFTPNLEEELRRIGILPRSDSA